MFRDFLSKQKISTKDKPFIQIFTSDNDPKKLQLTLHLIKTVLPFSKIIATSTAGDIADGEIIEDNTIISLSIFDATDIHVELFEDSEIDNITDKISALATSRTKLIIAFNNVYENDGEIFLNSLESKIPKVIVAGGNAAGGTEENASFLNQTVIGVGGDVSTIGIAVAIFDSDTLQIFSDMLFNWQTIGEQMTITKSDKSIVYEIDNQKAQEKYRHFLGDDVSDSLPASGVEFPLVFSEDGMDIARAPIGVGENGELIMAGHINEGTKVKFGFGDVSQNDKAVIEIVKDFAQKPIQSIFIYSCSARKYFLKEHLITEFEMLQKIAPTAGLITTGEFFKQNKCSKMLNVTSTFLGLSEDPTVKHNLDFKSKHVTKATRTLIALTHLVKQTSKDIEEKNLSLNQFQELIKDSTLYSTTDTKGIITDVNQGFIDLSGYSRDELIGKSHNIVRDNSVPSSVYKEMWNTIKNKKSWHGTMKNRSKNGKFYYVASSVYPMLNVNGKVYQYISIRYNITEEIQRKELLEGNLDYSEKETIEKEHLLEQYKGIINLSSSFFRMDANYNLLHVNDVFCDIYNSNKETMIIKNIVDIIESNFFSSKFKYINDILLKEKSWYGVVPFQRIDKTIIHMDTSVSTIFDEDENIVEYMVVMHDITDLIVAQEEITNTQKDVVFTMGAIGESRSKETGNHVKRVAAYSKVLALKYGLDLEIADMLKMVSPMHDIGKVGIPDSILNKPGKLTDDEWKIMKTHSALGYKMLKNSKREILKTAATVAYTHHEKWDGSGYPKGLKGEDIHIFGRITALADVFDALGSDRCYKKAWEDERIFEFIKSGSAKHFDPALVEIFFNNLDAFLDIRLQFQD